MTAVLFTAGSIIHDQHKSRNLKLVKIAAMVWGAMGHKVKRMESLKKIEQSYAIV